VSARLKVDTEVSTMADEADRGGVPQMQTPPDDRAMGDEALDDEEKKAAERFVSDLVARGEAARAVDGQLPPGATHEIIGEDAEGHPIVRRRRFSLK
jgi:hypothetical protein